MVYVAMTRGRHSNHAYLYERSRGEADHDHAKPVAGEQIHVLQRGTKYAAAQMFRVILTRDDRPRTMHNEADRTDRDRLPLIVADALRRNGIRTGVRRAEWQAHQAAARAWRSGYERAAARSTSRDRTSRKADGIEL
jgi:hypothetical protein